MTKISWHAKKEIVLTRIKQIPCSDTLWTYRRMHAQKDNCKISIMMIALKCFTIILLLYSKAILALRKALAHEN